jgi:hypothetical protein
MDGQSPCAENWQNNGHLQDAPQYRLVTSWEERLLVHAACSCVVERSWQWVDLHLEGALHLRR